MPRPIDADALVREVCGHNCGCERDECGMDLACSTVTYIESAPTLSPDDVRGVGEWIEKEVYNLEVTTIEQMQSASCSVCGKIHTTPFSYYFSKFNYCPNCGARMKGAEDETTDNT